MAVTRRKGNVITGGLRYSEYRTPQRVNYAKALAKLQGGKPFGLAPKDGGVWKDAPHPHTFQHLNSDFTGAIRDSDGTFYNNPNYYIDTKAERDTAASLLNYRDRRMGAGRFARSMQIYKKLGMNAPNFTRKASEVPSLVRSGLFDPNETIGWGGYGNVAVKAKIRDFDTGHRGMYNIQAAIDERNKRFRALQQAEGLTGHELPTSRNFFNEFVAPTIKQRDEWDERLAADDGEGRKTNPWAQAPLSFQEWLQYARDANTRLPDTLAALEPGGEYHHIGRYRPGHPDDPSPLEALRRLGLLPGMTPTSEGRRLAAVVSAGRGGMYS